jgi:hypothetical protein
MMLGAAARRPLALQGEPPPRFDATKTDFSYLTTHTNAEVLRDERPTDTVLEVLESIPVGTPVKRFKTAWDARIGFVCWRPSPVLPWSCGFGQRLAATPQR